MRKWGIVNLGYYPIKLTEGVFNDLKIKGKVLKFGGVIAVVENSYVINLDGYTFIFNDYILNKVPVIARDEVVEVNPFYTKHETDDLIKLLKSLGSEKVVIWTYEGDPVACRLALEGVSGALVLELREKCKGLTF